jgi:hypothetical protein
LKPNANFKLSKTSKRLLATFVDSHKRGEAKRAFVEAEMYAAIQPRISKNRKDQAGE